MATQVPDVRLPGKAAKRRFTGKAYLKMLIAVGLIAVIGGGVGTFASFNAQVNNPTTFSTGTLVLSDTAAATTCLSVGAGTSVNSSNTNSTCTGQPINVSIQEPGTTQTGTVTLQNVGTLPAGTLTLTVTCTPSNASGETYHGTGSLCANNTAAPNALDVYVQEYYGDPASTGVPYNCLYGATTGFGVTCSFSNSDTVGDLVTGGALSLGTNPGIATLSTNLSTGSPITSLPVNALTEAVLSGDSIVVTQGSHTQTFTASSGAAVGATAIPINSATPNFAYQSASTSVADSTSFPAFPATTVAGDTRYFKIGLELPSGADNTTQGIKAGMTLAWKEAQ